MFQCGLFFKTSSSAEELLFSPHLISSSKMTPQTWSGSDVISSLFLVLICKRTFYILFVILNVNHIRMRRNRVHRWALIQISCFQMTGLLIIGRCWMFNSHELACWFLLCEAPFMALFGHRPWNVWRRRPLLWHCACLWPSFQMTQYDIIVIFHLLLYLCCSSLPLLKFTSLSTLSHQSVMPEHAVQALLIGYVMGFWSDDHKIYPSMSCESKYKDSGFRTNEAHQLSKNIFYLLWTTVLEVVMKWKSNYTICKQNNFWSFTKKKRSHISPLFEWIYSFSA